MPTQPQNVPVAADELFGDVRLLLEQLGSPDLAPGVAGGLTVNSTADLRHFLQHYDERILRALELPAIHRAFNHASRGEVRELVDFDQHLAEEPLLANLRSASRRVGQIQLRRLRPLRDNRTVQRYLAAVDSGSAQGWHTLVYGLTLAVYSLPLRQGLIHYAEQTTRGFIQSASRELAISKTDAQALYDQTMAGLPQTVEALLLKEAATSREISLV